MRLRKIGVAAVAAGFCWCSGAYALDAAPRAAASPVVSTDQLLLPANNFKSTDLARLQSGLVGPLASEASLGSNRIHLAAATPIFGERMSGSQSQAAVAAAAFATTPPEQPPSAWLMGGVILLLIGYQLRRKHRLLRPHRFHRV